MQTATAPSHTSSDYLARIQAALQELGISDINPAYSTGLNWANAGVGTPKQVISPVDGLPIAKAQMADVTAYHEVVATATEAFKTWRNVPAPRRGEIVRQIGDAFRQHKQALGLLVSYEMGKIHQEGLGEVQEIIDICDFAVGLSRQLYGLTLPSERPDHRLMERWHPLGVVGIISAFNFPVAVWSWNAMLAAVCGNVSVWKPSEKTPLCGVAVQRIIQDVLRKNEVPEGVFSFINGERAVGEAMAADRNIALVSATGSTRMGLAVAQTVAARLGKYLLELGGNNAIILSQHANLKLAIPGILFGSVGTTGQRCTSTRRVLIHQSIYEQVKQQLVSAYQQVASKIGNPLEAGTLIGPMIDADAIKMMQARLEKVKAEGGNILVPGGPHTVAGCEGGHYVAPALVEAKPDLPSIQHETFAPILYIMPYSTLEEAIELHNNVPQGLSSAIFTTHFQEAERFLSASGSDCGIANVNAGTSGAEIGGAFGGEKETGGGRESGSDAWKVYMRRQTVTLNYSDQLPLAQGITFEF